MQPGVIEIKRLNDQWMAEERSLHRGLAGQVSGPFYVPDPLRPAHRPARAQQCVAPGQLPEREQAQQHGGLLHEPGGRGEQGDAGPLPGHGASGQHPRGHRRCLPGQFQVNHVRSLRPWPGAPRRAQPARSQLPRSTASARPARNRGGHGPFTRPPAGRRPGPGLRLACLRDRLP